MLLRRQTYRLRRDFLNSSRVTYSTSYSPLILEKDYTRLEMELKAMLDELDHQKDCNKLLCDEVTGLKMNIEHYKRDGKNVRLNLTGRGMRTWLVNETTRLENGTTMLMTKVSKPVRTTDSMPYLLSSLNSATRIII